MYKYWLQLATANYYPKMNRVFILTILLVYLHASAVESTEYDSFNYYDFNDECTTAGIMCKNCEELVQCVETSPGKFITVPLQKCNNTAGITCLNKQCSTETNPRCNNQQVPDFVCSNTGIFPDPYDCKRYHICAQAEDTINSRTYPPIDLKCLDNFGYDPVTTYCKTALANGACPVAPPIAPCKTAGESAAITGTSIYYICLFDHDILLPHLYMCPHGKKYVSYKCS